MDGYLKNTMTDLKNELTAIKLLELCSAHGVKPCNCIVDNLTRRHVKIALQNYLSLNKPVPVRFFKEKYRSLFLSEIRDHRDLLHRLKKPQQKAVKKESSRKSQSQSILPVTLPTTAEYYTERYGDLNGIICKVNSIFKCITKVIENSMYSIHSLSVMDPFKFVYEEIIKDFNKFKIEIEHVQRSMNNTVDQMVQNHQAIAKTCENIAQETRK
ncbi:Hypothetical protein CINCED_3A001934 [Cinara cedri]|uniref:Uncharacterized protein n=1 Tax=Cinara cedri TaxID=506608 RepID=A0A5E4ML11_9HEMI|nr:Hypothetical protein CINCED_3A001934 [Cinara cedri]